MTRLVLTLFIVAYIVISCQNTDHEGFKRLENSVHYSLDYLGDEDNPISKADYVSLKMMVFTNSDSLIAVKKFNRVRTDSDQFPTWLKSLMLKGNEGDSMVILGLSNELEISSLFNSTLIKNEYDDVKIALKFTEALTEKALREILAKDRLLEDLGILEQRNLERLKDSLMLGDSEYLNGIYYREIKPGNGVKPSQGSMIEVHYKTKLLNGKLLDDTNVGEPFEYEVGKPDQVLPGFSIGILNMSEGAEALFVIPSGLAFGQRGSSSGLVPPFSSLVYEVKLVKVRI
jgi:FKBP-type peptidyl-prolyl cis-trans isomerase FkpA